MSVTVHFLTTKHLDFNNILAYDTTVLESMMIHLTGMLVSVVTVKSSITPLLDGRHILVFALVPLDSLFAALIIMFKTMTNSVILLK